MIRALIGLWVMLCAGPVLALSCMPHGVTDAYHEAAAAKERYVIVTGTLQFDPRKLPKVDFERQDETPPSTLIPGQIRGQILDRRGFLQPFSQPVTIDVQCFGPWCAILKNGAPYLAFLQKSEDGYSLATNPCGGFAFTNPTGEMLRQVKICFNGGLCLKSRPR